MKNSEALEILRNHNQWRKGADIKPTEPKLLTEALNIAIHNLSQSVKKWKRL